MKKSFLEPRRQFLKLCGYLDSYCWILFEAYFAFDSTNVQKTAKPSTLFILDPNLCLVTNQSTKANQDVSRFNSNYTK